MNGALGLRFANESEIIEIGRIQCSVLSDLKTNSVFKETEFESCVWPLEVQVRHMITEHGASRECYGNLENKLSEWGFYRPYNLTACQTALLIHFHGIEVN